ncbi:MAG: HupE/UreJ family protein [Phenylobacterium sp.]
MTRNPTHPIAFAAAASVLLTAAGAALAHPGHAGHEIPGLGAGLLHPLTGVDHMLAMVAVGLWAALRGGRSLLTWPATFVAAMLVGFGLGGALGVVPGIEPAVLATVIVLGALTAANARMPDGAGLLLIALFGALHGYAHGADTAGGSFAFEAGMVATTAALHLAGIGLGLGLKRFGWPEMIRLLGLSAMAGGMALAVVG